MDGPVTPIGDAVRQSLADAFRAVPDGKRGALVVIADEHGARAMVAARLGDHWKVAAGTSTPWHGSISGTVAIEGSW
jgi:hypothetical protein